MQLFSQHKEIWRLLLVLFIVLAIPLTIFEVFQHQTYLNFAHTPQPSVTTACSSSGVTITYSYSISNLPAGVSANVTVTDSQNFVSDSFSWKNGDPVYTKTVDTNKNTIATGILAFQTSASDGFKATNQVGYKATGPCVSASPTPSPTPPTATDTPSPTPTSTPTPTSVPPTNTPTPTLGLTGTPSPTLAVSNTPTPTSTVSSTPTPIQSGPTPTGSATATPTLASGATSTPTPTTSQPQSTATPHPTVIAQKQTLPSTGSTLLPWGIAGTVLAILGSFFLL